MKKQSHKVAIASAVLLGGAHLGWAALVFTGMAQSVYDFILWAHMIELPLVITPFDAKAAITLVALTAGMGYVGGYVGSWVWHRMK